MSANMMFTAIAGLNTFNDALSVVSDNIANANSTGFKSNIMDFADLVSGLLPTNDNSVTAQGVGSQVRGITSDWANGNETKTGNWSDLMIQGNGFFCVQNPSNSSVDYYTRDGSFKIDSSGYLADMNGNFVLDSGGTKIQMDNTSGSSPTPYASYSITSDGHINVTDSSGTVSTLKQQIQVATFSNPDGLVRDGDNLYTADSNAGISTTLTAGSGQAGTLVSGVLEGSNVDITTQMVNLIDYQADYQANAKSIATGSTLLQTVLGLIPG